MITGIIGKKLGMTQVFNQEGEVVPVTVIEAGPCTVLGVKSAEKDGYQAVQLTFGAKKEKKVNKPMAGIFKKAGIAPAEIIKEIRLKSIDGIKAADKVLVDIFATGDYVDIIGTSIGKGFQGGRKRWNWKGGPRSHGSMSHKAPGSIGATTPQHVVKGHHLPGHMGNARVTIQNIEVIDVDKDNNLLVVKGAVPGVEGNFLLVKKALKKTEKMPKKISAPKKRDPLKQAKKAAAGKTVSKK